MADISISQLKANAAKQMQDLASVYAQHGIFINPITGQPQQDPAYLNPQQQAQTEATLQNIPGAAQPLSPEQIANEASKATASAIGEAQGKNSAPITDPNIFNQFGAQPGQSLSNVISQQKSPDLAAANTGVVNKASAYLDALNGLESLVPLLNNPKASSAFGPGGAINNFFRNELHLNVGTPEEQAFASQSNTVAQQILNALSQAEGGSNRPNGLGITSSSLPQVGQSLEMAQSNYRATRQRLLDEFTNLLSQYPNQASKLAPNGIQFSSLQEAQKYESRLPSGFQMQIFDNNSGTFRPAVKE